MTAQPNQQPSFNVSEFYNLVIVKVANRYNLSPLEEMELRSTFFYTLLESRIQNDALEYDGLLFNYDFIKQHTRECIKSFNKNTSQKISHQFPIMQFRNRLQMIKGQKDIKFELTDFIVSISDIEKQPTQTLNKRLALKIASNILKIFKVDLLPSDLHVVLLSEIRTILIENKELFKTHSQFTIIDLTSKIILGQIFTIGRRVDTKNGSVRYLNTPPKKEDLHFNIWANTFDPLSSLKMLTKIYGDELWYEQFENYNKNKTESYFSFSTEPYIKICQHNRSFEKVTIHSDISEFLSDKHREFFFNAWEKRLSKDDKSFFQVFVKPRIIVGCKEITIKNEKGEKGIEKTLRNIWDTSSFQFEYEEIFGSANIITSLNSIDDEFTLEINQSLYNNENLHTRFEKACS